RGRSRARVQDLSRRDRKEAGHDRQEDGGGGRRQWNRDGGESPRPQMSAQQFERHAKQFVRVAAGHMQCAEAGIIGISEDHARVYVVLNVEMPLPYASKGLSPNGVQLQERVEIQIGADYPWKSPSFFLREGFPRDLPHLSAGGGKSLPRPCIVDGS